MPALTTNPRRALSLFDVVLMSVIAVTTLRWIAAAAANGPSSLVLWVLAAAMFLVPEALAVADLAATHPDTAGLYGWTTRALGPGHGYLCGWCYWLNNLLFFPSLLMFTAGNVAFAVQRVHPQWQLEHDKGFVVLITLGTLWAIALLSILGMRVGKWVQNAGSLANWIVVMVVIGFGVVAFARHGSANALTASTLRPSMHEGPVLSTFAQMCFAFSGLELLSFFGTDMRNPLKGMTVGLFISTFLITGIYVLGTLGVLVAVPQQDISLVNGLLLPIETVAQRLGAGWATPLAAALLAVGGVATTMAWFAGSAKLPQLIGIRFGAPYRAILWQAVIATGLTLLATVGAATKMEAGYRVLVDMCLILYFIPYCYLFVALFVLRRRFVVAGVGFLTTAFAILMTLWPADRAFDGVSLFKTLGGTVFMLGVGWLIFARAKLAPPAYHECE